MRHYHLFSFIHKFINGALNASYPAKGNVLALEFQGNLSIQPGTHRGVPLRLRDRLLDCFTMQYYYFIQVILTAIGGTLGYVAIS